ncbi:hypothetical protein DMC47_04955 [Nostoc sp. 3335mG]|nr:hypothetical protein DMC47_04955 [Nostoc sp. 3335mG]
MTQGDPSQSQVDTSTTTTQQSESSSQGSLLPWILAGAAVLAGLIALMFFRRRRTEDEVYYDEPVVVDEPVAAREPVVVREPVVAREPIVAREPVIAREERVAPSVDGDPELIRMRQEREAAMAAAAVAPVVAPTAAGDPELIRMREERERARQTGGDPELIRMREEREAAMRANAAAAEEVEVVEAESDDVAGLTAAAPVSQRPWLEFGMRPVRAGTSAEEALVDIELTVANAGDIDARDVRISTFLLSETEASEMEKLMIERDSTEVPPVTIPAGEGKRVDATLTLRKDGLPDAFTPVVVADARYRLPDGSEGRTSASFRVGLWNDSEALEPIATNGTEMHANVAAELHGTPERV